MAAEATISRIVRRPIPVPSGVEIKQSDLHVEIKGKLGTLSHQLPESVNFSIGEDGVTVFPANKERTANALAATNWRLIKNMIHGVSAGFERKLVLKGVGYRAQVQGNTLTLKLGKSHDDIFPVPEGVAIECPSQTEILIKSTDNQLMGQVAAEIRSLRPPEPYKGKGIRYADEHIVIKETKKK